MTHKPTGQSAERAHSPRQAGDAGVPGPRVPTLMVGVCFLLAVFVTAIFFLRLYRPEPRMEWPPPPAPYDRAAMQEAMEVAAVSARQAEILEIGPRFMGLPGHQEMEALVRKHFQEAGLEIYEHHLRTAAPVTQRRELSVRGEEGEWQVPAGVEIFPFLPNHMQPPVTPAEGLTGELVVLDEETIRTRRDFSNVIGLIDASAEGHPEEFGFHWVRYARLGVKALVLAHPEGFASVPWIQVIDRYEGMTASVPVNFVRVAATSEIFNYVGQEVRLRVTVKWEDVPHNTLIGVMRAPEANGEAIVMAAPRDTPGALPDASIGVLSSLRPAVQLQLLEGLLPYREELRRDVIFISTGASFMAEDGLNELISLLLQNKQQRSENPLLGALGVHDLDFAESGEEISRRLEVVQQEMAANETLWELVRGVQVAMEEPGFLRDPETTSEILGEMEEKVEGFLREQLSYVLQTIVFELSEDHLQARLKLERADVNDPEDPRFLQYLEEKRVYNEANSVVGFRLLNLLSERPETWAKFRIEERLRERFVELDAFHAEEHRRMEGEVEIVNLFDEYRVFSAFETRVYPAAPGQALEEILTFDVHSGYREPDAVAFQEILTRAVRELGVRRLVNLPALTTNHGSMIAQATEPSPRATTMMWRDWGYSSYSFTTLGRRESFLSLAEPTDEPWMRDLRSIEHTLAVIGETLLAVAHGAGDLVSTPNAEHRQRTYGGKVVVSNVGQSIVPNYPLKGAVIGNRSFERAGQHNFPGFYNHKFLLTDPYGRFLQKPAPSDFVVWWRASHDGTVFTPLAGGFDEDGFLTVMKDEGLEGQRLFKSVNIPINGERTKDVTVVTFRAAPMAVLDLTNPQTMKSYTGVELMTAEGLTEPRKIIKYRGLGFDVLYVEPDVPVYATFKSGAAGNELVQTTRAFALNVDETPGEKLEREIDGVGYLPEDTPYLWRVPGEIAPSMLYVNGERLDLQRRYGMADNQVIEYHERAEDFARRASTGEHSVLEADRLAGESVVFSTLNHPVLRESVFEAVLGILWYLGLLVPFVFFFEKLLFCHTDVRRQIAAQAVIFLVVFALLRVLHPAFEMVRSSLMILLGFIIILISGGITLLFSSKFRENLEELRRQQGKVTAAEVNKMGVLGSAFMLGLNNMHRRKVRTGLTCATLTLLTFVMISFTSVKNDVVEDSTALGKAPYQGFLIRKDRFITLKREEVFAFQQKYGDQFEVCQRQMYLGLENWKTNTRSNPEVELVYGEGGFSRRVEAESILLFNHNEPLRHGIEFLTKNSWFSAEDEIATDRPVPIIIPEEMASRLGLSSRQVDGGEAFVRMNGRTFRVHAIFRSSSLDELTDLDGLNLLPFDIEAMATVVSEEGSIVAEATDARIPASQVVLAPLRDLGVGVNSSRDGIPHPVSLVVSMPGTSFREANDAIDSYMIQSGQPLHYGLDGVAYQGERTRRVSLAGLVDMLIPLLIAAMTVLNTMKGSVYERRSEIFVYNAVGIAPRYVFFMFIAEALVYAVVGSILGYLMSQGIGRILTELGLTGGLNMTYASLATIYASLTIVAAVFFSTLFPARSAMEIAAPAEEAGWRLPEPEEDVLAFDLPFNFRTRGRFAILVFFERYLLDHGEGSSGRFFAADPEIVLQPQEEGDLLPLIRTTTWLKPYDLAVSQRITITLPVDPETGLYKARISLERLSGTRESWLRLNEGFVAMLRRQFLHWRAVPEAERESYFTEAKERLRTQYAPPPDDNPGEDRASPQPEPVTTT